MSSVSFLNFQYSISRKSTIKPTRVTSTAKERQKPSVQSRIFHPNVEEMKSVFDKFDKNRDGKISQEEYTLALRVMGGRNGKMDVAKAFQAADTDGDGFINFKEFMKVHNAEGGVKTADIQSAFRVFDADGNGKISAEELFEVLRRMGERSSLEACKKWLEGADADGDGLIDMDEFMTMMTRTI